MRSSFPTLLALLGAAMLALAIGTVGWLHHSRALAELRYAGEEQNAALARAVATTLRAALDEFLLEGPASPARLAALRRQIGTAVQGTRIAKVKLYDRAGLTVFSSDPREIGTDQSRNAGFRAARAGGLVSQLSFRDQFDAFDGVVSDRDLLSTYLPVRGGDGPVRGVFEIYSDVTELRAATRETMLAELAVLGGAFAAVFAILLWMARHGERALARAAAENRGLAERAEAAEAASRAKSAFLIQLGGTLRPELDAIIAGCARLGAAPGPEDPAGAIDAAARRLLGLLGDAVDLVRIEAGRMPVAREAVDLPALLDRVMEELRPKAAAAGVRLGCRADPGLTTLESDGFRLGRVLATLVGNAVRFTPRGGAVEVEVRAGSQPPMAEILVADTGSGIAAEDLARHLAPSDEAGFAAGKSGGGIGLRLSRSVVERLGGVFEVASAPGAGTRVSIRLPLCPPEPPAAEI
jgi:two-component system, cell cycle sensor histidine kinase PleC